MEPFETGLALASELKKLAKPMLLNIVKFYYDARPAGLGSMKKDTLVAEVTSRIVPRTTASPIGQVASPDETSTNLGY